MEGVVERKRERERESKKREINNNPMPQLSDKRLVYSFFLSINTKICGCVGYHDVFDVAKEVAKVDVEEIAMCCDHYVVVMAITNTLNILYKIVYSHMTCNVIIHIYPMQNCIVM